MTNYCPLSLRLSAATASEAEIFDWYFSSPKKYKQFTIRMETIAKINFTLILVDLLEYLRDRRDSKFGFCIFMMGLAAGLGAFGVCRPK